MFEGSLGYFILRAQALKQYRLALRVVRQAPPHAQSTSHALPPTLSFPVCLAWLPAHAHAARRRAARGCAAGERVWSWRELTERDEVSPL